MACNLSKNGAALMDAYKDVLDAKSNTNWALFTYEGNSNNIRLAEKGEGGLEEMVEELSSGKVMYAFCRVQDPNSGLPKYVLINWTGEGVKDSWKGACASHVTSMASFLKGAHVTINARGEDDVEPESILGKVGKASGADFRFNRETRGYGNVPAGPVGSVYQKTNAADEIQRTNKENFDGNVPAGPVGSVYQKTNAVDEIQRTNKENFWAQDKSDEAARKSEVSKEATEKIQQLEKDRKEEEEKQSAERDKRTKERASQIDQQRAFQKRQESMETKPEQQQEIGHSPKKGIQFAASVQKANEAKGLISQRSFNPKDVFQQRGNNSAVSNGQSPVASRPGKLQSPFLSQSRTESETTPKPKSQREWTPPVIRDPSPVTEALPIRDASPSPVNPPIPDTSPVRSESFVPAAPSPVMPDVSTSPVPTPDVSTTAVKTPLMPVLSTSPVQTPVLPDEPTSPAQTAASTEEDYWSDDFDEEDSQDLYNDPKVSPGQEEMYEEEMPSSVPEEDLYENVYDEETPPVEGHGATCSARALYDYQAADDTEITFDPDDIITGIEKLDDGWWRGYAPNGHYGMFPANYVELV